MGAAEIVMVCMVKLTVIQLQWSRSLGSCGNNTSRFRLCVYRCASMEPQPWELRKWLCPMFAYLVRAGASMEPQPWELRKCDRRIRTAHKGRLQWGRSLGSCGRITRRPVVWSCHAFNGAAGSRKDLTRHGVRLQWGRSLGSCGNM